jgi:peptide/nickel transport system permease protein
MIAIPSLSGVSTVLFAVPALAPGDPFGEPATNPNVPPEVRANLRMQFGMDDPGVALSESARMTFYGRL